MPAALKSLKGIKIRSTGSHRQWYVPCPSCGKKRWVNASYAAGGLKARCAKCAGNARRAVPPKGVKTRDGKTKGREWLLPCKKCGKKRWVQANRSMRTGLCISCSGRSNRLSPPKGVKTRHRQYASKTSWEWLMPCVDCGKRRWIAAYRSKRVKRCRTCAGTEGLKPPKGIRVRRRKHSNDQTQKYYRQWLTPCIKCGEKKWTAGSVAAKGQRVCRRCFGLKPPPGVRIRIPDGRVGYEWLLPCPGCREKRWQRASSLNVVHYCPACSMWRKHHPRISDESLRRIHAIRVCIGLQRWNRIIVQRAYKKYKIRRLDANTNSVRKLRPVTLQKIEG